MERKQWMGRGEEITKTTKDEKDNKERGREKCMWENGKSKEIREM